MLQTQETLKIGTFSLQNYGAFECLGATIDDYGKDGVEVHMTKMHCVMMVEFL